jgi:hypothetical protein
MPAEPYHLLLLLLVVVVVVFVLFNIRNPVANQQCQLPRPYENYQAASWCSRWLHRLQPCLMRVDSSVPAICCG